MPELKLKPQVMEIVKSIPTGKVASYGQVAALAGSPRAARQVGWILAGLGPQNMIVPWWRVINSQGYISIRGHASDIKDVQRDLLLQEGVDVSDEYYVELGKYRWIAD